MFAYNQSILLVGPWWEVLITVVTTSIGVFCLAAALEGYLILSLNRFNRLAVGPAALLLIFPSWVAAIPGSALLACLLIIQFRKQSESN